MLHSDERIQVKGCILYWSPSFNRCQSQMSLGQLRCGWKSKIESTAATRCQKGTVLNTRGSCSEVVFNFAIQCTVIDLSDVRPLGQRADCVKSFFSCGKGFFFFFFSYWPCLCCGGESCCIINFAALTLGAQSGTHLYGSCMSLGVHADVFTETDT